MFIDCNYLLFGILYVHTFTILYFNVFNSSCRFQVGMLLGSIANSISTFGEIMVFIGCWPYILCSSFQLENI
jgi:hypothetical protein